MPSDIRSDPLQSSAPESGDGVRAMLYTLNEHDCALELSDIDPEGLDEKQLV